MKYGFVLVLSVLLACAPANKEKVLQTWIDNHVAQVKPLQKQINLAYWQAACSGDTNQYAAYARLNLQLRQIYSNKQDFIFLKETQKSGQVHDPLLTRQLTLLINSYTENQIDADVMKQMVELAANVEQKFSTFRSRINGKSLSNNQIDEIFKTEIKSTKRQQTWEASKQVGSRVANDLVNLVKLRNQAATGLGYKNYHDMSLQLVEQSEQEIEQIFNELYDLSAQPFAAIKKQLDEELAKKYQINAAQIRPWHYNDPFFQEAPAMAALDYDRFYTGKDVKLLAADFFDGIGMPAADILSNSDLYEREGKNPHAFCTDIDREGDVRILCNLQNNERWMETALHELGHAVYDKYHDMKLPYLLRQPAHAFTTEAMANFFGRFSRNADWMKDMLSLDAKAYQDILRVGKASMRAKQLIFARWAMVMYFFEKELYANPDQDLNGLWWQLVQKYQLVTPPPDRHQPDWAAKIHFTIAPCYYHNYLLGELLASQLTAYVTSRIVPADGAEGGSPVRKTALGRYLQTTVFAMASKYRWNEMIEKATEEPLTAKYFVQQFMQP